MFVAVAVDVDVVVVVVDLFLCASCFIGPCCIKLNQLLISG